MSCGDEIEARIALQAVPLEQRPDYPYCSFDASHWADAFVKHNPAFDKATALSWFASALMRGYDEGRLVQIQHQQRAQRWINPDGSTEYTGPR